ncbi:MAG: hypothetical protein ACTTHG_07640 [Treponemataceae bacterium]
MLKLEKTAVMNFENAIRGARNPMNSWDKMDSTVDINGNFIFGTNDLTLARKLCKAGSDHRKFVRQIFICTDITAPIYWWKEFDTYKIGTVANSTSTMHKIHSKPFEISDFSTDHMEESSLECLKIVLKELESKRQIFVTDKIGNKKAWYSIIQLLPESYNQTRTITMNYENVFGMYNSRHSHKLEEWHTFCDWIMNLPYFKEMFFAE